jgi:hypothetical protein
MTLRESSMACSEATRQEESRKHESNAGDGNEIDLGDDEALERLGDRGRGRGGSERVER